MPSKKGSGSGKKDTPRNSKTGRYKRSGSLQSVRGAKGISKKPGTQGGGPRKK